MTPEELKKYIYIIESFRFGETIEKIQQTLLVAGYKKNDIQESFQKLGLVKKVSDFHFHGKAKTWQAVIYLIWVLPRKF